MGRLKKQIVIGLSVAALLAIFSVYVWIEKTQAFIEGTILGIVMGVIVALVLVKRIGKKQEHNPLEKLIIKIIG